MKKKTYKALKTIIALLVLAALLVQPVFASGGYASREEVPDEYKWDLTHIYETLDDWESDAALLTDELLPRVAGYRGLLDGKESVLDCLRALTDAGIVIDRLYRYASLYLDMDMGAPDAQRLYGMASFLDLEFMETSAYIIPELSRIDKAILEGYMNDPDFAQYRKLIDYVIKNMPHILSDEETALLARATLLTQSPLEIYLMLKMEGDYDVYSDFQNTFATILAAEVHKNIFLAKSHNYDSALEAALSPEIPVSVYENLIDSVSDRLVAFHSFIEILDEIDRLDAALRQSLNQPLYEQRQTEILYEDAKEILLSALAPLGEEYSRTLETAFENNWIDVFPTPNKRSGAYSMGMYEPHPYVLMDYYGTFYCVSVLAHEMGHAVHQYYSSAAQTFHDYSVDSFTTEVASTVNQILLHRHMIDSAETDVQKLFYMNELANMYETNFFFQTMLAEFQKDIYDRAEAAEPLNAETLSELYLELLQKYFGPGFEIIESDATRWAAFPHFYYGFYVYQYATSMAAASELASRIMSNEPGALELYLDLLRSGSLNDPVTTLAKVGLDMTSPQVIEAAIDEFAVLVEDIEALFESVKAGLPVPQAPAEEEAPPQTETTSTQEPGSVPNEYIVRLGDTLAAIAHMFNTTWQELQRLNSIKDPNLIHPGQVIILY